MSVVVTGVGRLGNNLFQYAFARIVAERLGYALRYADASDGRPAGESTLSALAAYFPAAGLELPGEVHPSPVESHAIGPGRPWAGQSIDLRSMVGRREPRRIELCGFFQRFEYFEDAQDRIRRWFEVGGTAVVEPGPSDVVVSIRRDRDFGLRGWTLPLSYYTGALESMDRIGTVFLCGTGIDPAVEAALAKFRPITIQGSAIDHFRTITRFRRIIASNSTFAWWAAFLSEAREIVGPATDPESGLFAFRGFPEVDLHMRNPRYRERHCVDAAPYRIAIDQDRAAPMEIGPRVRDAALATGLGSDVIAGLLRLVAVLHLPGGVDCADLRRHVPGRVVEGFIRWLEANRVAGVLGYYPPPGG